MVIFGDDQYENFREEIIPPYCLHIYDEIECLPFHDGPASMGRPTIWDRQADEQIVVQHHTARAAPGARADRPRLRHALRAEAPRRHGLAHAHLNTVTFLDRPAGLPLRCPISVNCLGSDVFEPFGVRGGRGCGRAAAGPSPRRCFALGRASRRPRGEPLAGRDNRLVGLVALFPDSRASGLYSDVDADRARFADLEAGQQARWRT